jgi:hypothetical protein
MEFEIAFLNAQLQSFIYRLKLLQVDGWIGKYARVCGLERA